LAFVYWRLKGEEDYCFHKIGKFVAGPEGMGDKMAKTIKIRGGINALW
jgi:hypothetical protein